MGGKKNKAPFSILVEYGAGVSRGSENAVVTNEVEPGRRDQRGKLLQQLEGFESDVGRTVAIVLDGIYDARDGMRFRPLSPPDDDEGDAERRPC